MAKKQTRGIIVSDKMDKTRIVLVERLKKHPKYKKYYKIKKRFKADDRQNQYKTGDKVIIEESRPLSKDKKWRIKNLI